ncbi:TetR/AcrR family transcriptional regulator [Hespellia stercorisuis]|uniref:Transcriptional regulator, TetR family n=1 Tax=Hespellia stercorisuis DSM 15480 TaxID=1121950 RepID=A0A1M6IC06_9FIRM|nr:TetR/AcrR family transcriptional regulator [Hespellia stercorisuis]SHJ31945.1 transcriptional regulator, TetR family [Hespellia stercorisuis DSM 15480]
MAKPDKSIDPRILDCAKQEFLEKGFEKASLQNICKNAEVTTGALYKRFKGKEELFCTIVEPTIAAIYEMVQSRSVENLSLLSDEELIGSWKMKEENVMSYFQFFYQHKDGFVMLLKHSAGTKHQEFHHELVALMGDHTIRYYKEGYQRGLFQRKISEVEFHVLLSAFWETVYEPFIHDMPWAEIESHVRLICKYFDWLSVLDIKQ